MNCNLLQSSNSSSAYEVPDTAGGGSLCSMNGLVGFGGHRPGT